MFCKRVSANSWPFICSEERGKRGHQHASKTLLMIGTTLSPGFEIFTGDPNQYCYEILQPCNLSGGGGPDPLSPYLDQLIIYSTSPTEEA